MNRAELQTYMILAGALLVVGITLVQCVMPAEAQTQREALDSMTVAQFVPGSEEYQIWSIYE